MSIKSPCVLLCSIEEATGYCHGCGRTIGEISNWLTMSDAERDALRLQLRSDATERRRAVRRDAQCALFYRPALRRQLPDELHTRIIKCQT